MTSISHPELGLVDSEGRLERQGDWATWDVPEVSLENGVLVWQPERTKTVHSGPGLLERFLALRDDNSGKGIAAYASRWGVLQICDKHGVPWSHTRPPWGLSFYIVSRSQQGCRPRGWEKRRQGGPAIESLEDWRKHARALHSLTVIAAHLQERKLPPADAWKIFYAGPPGVLGIRYKKVPWWRRSLLADGIHLARALSQLLDIGDVRVEVATFRGHPVITLGGPGLFGALAIQMLMVASASASLFFCHGCGRPFTLTPPRRRPQSGRHHYCPQCGTEAAQRDAALRYRQKKRTERNRHVN